MTAELTSPSGWHSTVPLSDPESFTGNTYEGTVTLDLNALEDKAEAAAAVTGVSAAPVSIALTPRVTTESGAEFKPKLPLTLTPLQLSLVGGEQALTVTDSATSQQTVLAPRTIGFNGWNITAATACVVSALLLFAVIVAGAVLLALARRTAPLDEASGIRRRYSSLLVRVHPMLHPRDGRSSTSPVSLRLQSWPNATDSWSCTGTAAAWKPSLCRTKAPPTATAHQQTPPVRLNPCRQRMSPPSWKPPSLNRTPSKALTMCLSQTARILLPDCG